MGGSISAKSTPGQGSVFSFDISVVIAEESEEQGNSSSDQRIIGLAPDQPSFRILVVEDIQESRTFLVNLLKNIGFHVKEAVHGKQGVELFHAWQPHLIWMDLRMPVMDGYEAVRQIKQTEAGKDTVIIALSAHVLKDEREKIFQLGCDGFLSKPYTEQDLFAMMAKHLGVRFQYEGDKNSSLASQTPQAFLDIPEDIKKKLLAAAALLDQNACLAILDQMQSTDPTEIAWLKAMIKNYNFEDVEKRLI
jgi:CheY-like chemotaxis protein